MKKIRWNDGWNLIEGNGECRKITLPHDAMQETGRDVQAPSGNSGAHYSGGHYTYTKSFDVSKEEMNKAFMIHFDGIYNKSQVYVNDVLVSSQNYGYLPFFADATGKLVEGVNVVRVEADNSNQPNSRWYTGSGIYRSVQLWTGSMNHIMPQGVRVKTLQIDPAIIQIDVACAGVAEELKVEIYRDNTLQCQTMITDVLHQDGQSMGSVQLEIENARLWSDEEPQLYQCRVQLCNQGQIEDETSESFGIRSLHYDTTGFYVNDKRTLLRGGCLHHDNGILGACSISEAEERRLRIMKDAGFNAIRCAHCPASTELLELCDRLGIYVMDEMWDMWYQRKNKYDYGTEFLDNWKQDVAAVVDRDYSHPSVIMYSIGNEVTEPYQEQGVIQGKEIIEEFHRLDNSRPTTIGLNMALLAMSAMGIGLFDHVDDAPKVQPAAVNSTVFNETVSRNSNLPLASCKPEVDALSAPILDAVDIAGYNYAAPRYPMDATEHPNRISVGSETFPHDLASTWKTMEDCPYVIGDFMWTAWDYIGECGIGTWSAEEDALEFDKPYPWKLADVGAFDLIGDPTGEALWTKAVWKGATSLAVRPPMHAWEDMARGSWRGTNAMPSWSWQGCQGKLATVEVYTPGSQVELYVNDELVASNEVTDMRAVFTLPYEEGTLLAVAYDDSKQECGRDQLVSATGNLHWKVEEEAVVSSKKVRFYNISLRDDNQTVECNQDEMLEIQVTGGELLGFGSAQPRTQAEFLSGRYPSRYGRALAAVRVTEEKQLQVTVRSI